MLLLNPKSVFLGDTSLSSVRSITIDRRADGLAEAWTDAGPHQVFCDATKVRTIVRIVQQLDAGSAAELAGSPALGALEQLRFIAAINNAPRGCTVTLTGCIVAVNTELAPGPIAGPTPGSGAARVAQRIIMLHAISSNGQSDPVQAIAN